MMARAKRVYISIIKDNNWFSFISSRCFLKEIENILHVAIEFYIITQVILAFWLALAYDLILEDRCTIDAIISKFLVLLVLKWRKVLRIKMIFYAIERKKNKNVWSRHKTGKRRTKKKEKVVFLKKNTRAVSVGSRARLDQTQKWSWNYFKTIALCRI